MSDSGDVRAGAGGGSGPGAASGEPAPEGLSLRGLRVVYRGTRGGAPVTAVDGVDLDVARGQPPVSPTEFTIVSVSSAEFTNPISSRSHCTAALATNTEPSKA